MGFGAPSNYPKRPPRARTPSLRRMTRLHAATNDRPPLTPTTPENTVSDLLTTTVTPKGNSEADSLPS